MMRRRPESTAHAIATKTSRKDRRTSMRRIRDRVPEGPITTAIPIDPGATGQFGARGISITASAQVLNGKNTISRKRMRPPQQSWQKEAWLLRSVTGELRFAGDRQARALSQTRLFIAERVNPDADPAPVLPESDAAIADLSDSMFGSAAANQQSMKRAGQHLINNGESTIIVKQEDDRFTWSVHSVSEITGNANSWKLNDGVQSRAVGADELLIRVWSPDPEWEQLADAPVRSILPIARELEGLTKYVSAQIDSRLAGSGLLLIPEGLSVVRPAPDANDDNDDADEDDYTLADELGDYMTIPITDRGSAGSVVPFMLEGPAQELEKVQHIKFDSPLDENAPKLRDEAIRRIALGMDSDPMVLLGMQGGNHWSAWAVSEDEVRLGVAPLAATICHALTTGWLTPMLEELGVQDPHRYQVWFDTTPLELRPDRSKDARELYDKNELSAAAMRRENGFSDDDAPDSEELKKALLTKLVIGAPSLAPLLLPLLGIEVDAAVLDKTQEITKATDGQDTDADEPAPPAEPEPENSPPTTKDTPPPAADSEGTAPQ